MFDIIGAAGETSGITLTYAYWALSKRPDVMARLRLELSTLPQSLCRTASSKRELPDAKTLDRLPLLNAITTETLRRWPAVPGAQPRITPDGPTTLGGYSNIPPNVKVQAYAYSMHRNRAVFPDPETWNPDRWLTASEDQLKEMHRWYMVWGQGGRMCLGSHFAIYCKYPASYAKSVRLIKRITATKMAIASIYSNYTTSIVDDFGGMEQMDGFTCPPKTAKVLIRFHSLTKEEHLEIEGRSQAAESKAGIV